MQIILQEDVEKLGNRGELVEVAEGYARNFLLPRKLALEATPGNMKRLEKMRVAFAKKEATEKDAAQRLAEAARRRFSHTFAQGRRERPAVRLRHFGGHFRSARRARLHHREAQNRAHRSDQARRRVRNSAEAPSRSHGQRQARRHEGSVGTSIPLLNSRGRDLLAPFSILRSGKHPQVPQMSTGAYG